MGNWRTIQIVGTCDRAEVAKLKEAIAFDYVDPKYYGKFHCLSNTGGIAGLGDWAGEHINRVGNLAERDYSVVDVAEQLKALAAVAPSLKLKVHCGGDYEDRGVVATITVDGAAIAGGLVVIEPPEIESLPDIPQEQMRNNFVNALLRGPRA